MLFDCLDQSLLQHELSEGLCAPHLLTAAPRYSTPSLSILQGQRAKTTLSSSPAYERWLVLRMYYCLPNHGMTPAMDGVNRRHFMTKVGSSGLIRWDSLTRSYVSRKWLDWRAEGRWQWRDALDHEKVAQLRFTPWRPSGSFSLTVTIKVDKGICLFSY